MIENEVDLNIVLLKTRGYQIGDIYGKENVTPKDFGRVGAQAAKQAVMQRLRDAEREILFEEFIDKKKVYLLELLTVLTIVMYMCIRSYLKVVLFRRSRISLNEIYS